MSKYNFNLQQKELLDKIRSPRVYEFNLAENMALLSNDPSVIRRFYQEGIATYEKDTWLLQTHNQMFLGHFEPGQAFCYVGIVPMIVQGKVNLIASNGFECSSKNKEIDKILNRFKDEAELETKFANGAYLESGLGDFAYRLSYDPSVSDKPIIDVIEPQFLDVNYSRGAIKSFVIKEINADDPRYELHEIHYKNKNGYVCIEYKYMFDGRYVAINDDAMIESCKAMFPDVDTTPRAFPLKDFLIIYKQNNSFNKLYKGERGVPDIQGMSSIEDALAECVSDLMDAIRKGGVREYISDELIPQTPDGRQMMIDPFKKRVITTKASSTPGESGKMVEVVQGAINWEAHIKPIQTLMSVAINKAGLAPTTLGLTGLESINSSAESQDAREKTSIRTRELCLKGWEKTLKDLFNRYLQVLDIINEREPLDYSDLINIQFNEYTNPSVENITDILATQVSAGLKSRQSAIKELNDGISDEEADNEFMQIMAEQGAPVMAGEQTQGAIVEEQKEQEYTKNNLQEESK